MKTYRLDQKLLELWFITVKGYRLNSSKGKDAWGRVQENSMCRASKCLLSGEAQMTLTFLAVMFDSMHRVLPSRESQPILGIQNFYWASVL